MLSCICKSHAATLQVPADYPTIQAAVDAAVDGDTVQIAPGVYKENVIARNKSVNIIAPKGVTGSENDILATVIDAGGNGFPALTLANVGLPQPTIQGFAVRGGYPAGLKTDGFSGYIRNIVAYSNLLNGVSLGGTVTLNNNGVPEIIVSRCSDLIIRDNQGVGLGLYCTGAYDLARCLIIKNQGWGIETACDRGANTFRDCIINKNGAGVSLGTPGSFVNCTINGNAGLSMQCNYSAIIRNTIIIGTGKHIRIADSILADFDYNIIQGGNAAFESRFPAYYNYGAHNINSDLQIFDYPELGTLRPIVAGLEVDSGDSDSYLLHDYCWGDKLPPCRNFGIPSGDSLDILKNPRIRGKKIDIGAYESSLYRVNDPSELAPIITQLVTGDRVAIGGKGGAAIATILDNQKFSLTVSTNQGFTFLGWRTGVASPTEPLPLEQLLNYEPVFARYVAAGGSIQAAIDASDPGETILLAPATFDESLTILKPIRLMGSTNVSVLSTGPRTIISPSKLITNDFGKLAIYVNAGDVEIGGITVRKGTLMWLGRTKISDVIAENSVGQGINCSGGWVRDLIVRNNAEDGLMCGASEVLERITAYGNGRYGIWFNNHSGVASQLLVYGNKGYGVKTIGGPEARPVLVNSTLIDNADGNDFVLESGQAEVVDSILGNLSVPFGGAGVIKNSITVEPITKWKGDLGKWTRDDLTVGGTDPKFVNRVLKNYAPLAGSPAINRGSTPSVSSSTTDVLGKPRVQGGIVDLGAVEASVGTVVGWGENMLGQTNVPAGLYDILLVGTGERSSAAMRRDGSVLAWGDVLINNTVSTGTTLEGFQDLVALEGMNYLVGLRRDGVGVSQLKDAERQAVLQPVGKKVVALDTGGNSHVQPCIQMAPSVGQARTTKPSPSRRLRSFRDWWTHKSQANLAWVFAVMERWSLGRMVRL
jgi:hypothetical protein